MTGTAVDTGAPFVPVGKGASEAAKDAAEEARDAIFRKLEAEEMQRRAEKEFQENLRNELYFEEGELAARARE